VCVAWRCVYCGSANAADEASEGYSERVFRNASLGSLRGCEAARLHAHDGVALAAGQARRRLRLPHGSMMGAWRISELRKPALIPARRRASDRTATARHSEPHRRPLRSSSIAPVSPNTDTQTHRLHTSFTMVHKVLFWSGLGNALTTSAHRQRAC
jgi:hypothetical protein